ncbi:MAG: hypothetical protein FGF48_06335 [Candidatus Brockarchaeota archaeon]|nr:hypothetical protein [Candidatus Brockarchaeota archaeon]
MEKKLAGIFLILLVLTFEFNSILLFETVSAQPEEFARKLEEHLGRAIPEDLLAEECEYVVPEGFNLTLAERLWRDFSFHISAGCTTEELRGEVKRAYGNASLVNATLSNGITVVLNISGISVERNLGDGSVSIRVPVASSFNLNYSRYNFTKKPGFYEAWNKTLIREYRVWRREPGWYNYTFKDLESNKSFTVVSKIWGEASRVEESWLEGLRKLGGGAWNEPVKYLPSFEYTKWGWLRTSGPIIAVPGHYEDVRVIYPEHERSFKVLFPAYDPIIIEGWIIHVNISSTSLNVGETLGVSFSAEYCSPFGGTPEPLNATLTLYAPDSLEPLNGVERKLDDTHTEGFFRLKAVKPGTYNITLRLEGNAVFENTGGKEETYTVQIASPPAPLLSIEIAERDTSVLKHARLVLRLCNNGGGPARNVVLEITGGDMESVTRSLGSIEPGESRDVELTLRLLQPASLARIRVAYSDEEGNTYLVGFETTVSTETFWVPEHFEEYTVIVPEHEETLRVFVPGCEAATHVRFYALWDERILGEAVFTAERLGETPYYETSLRMGLIPVPIPGLGVELSINAGRKALTEAGVKIMVTSIEPYYKYLGVLGEEELLRLVDTDKQSLRSGNVSSDFKVEPMKPYWVKGSSVVLNATQLALYQAMMDDVKKANPDIDYEYRETIADVRTRVGSAEQGYVTLLYHPLKTSGEGPLRGIRVRNFAGVGFEYRVNVESKIVTVFGKVKGENGWKHLYLSGKEDAVLLSPSPSDGFEREVTVNLTYNGRLVAQARFTLKPESSPYWKGFWDGLASQAWKIVISVGLMVIVGFIVPAGHVVTASRIILGVGVAMNLLEVGMDVYNAYKARDEMNALANETLERAGEYLDKGDSEHAGECVELARRLRIEANATIENLGINALSELLIDVTWDEICVALRWKEPLVLPGENKDYKIGYATGRVAGAIVLCMLYASFYAMIAKIKAERIAGEPLSVSQILRMMGRGIYNWITPAIWDAVVLMRGKIGSSVGKVVDLLLGNKYSSRFGEAVGSLLQDARGELPKIKDTVDASSEISRNVLENVPSKESSGKILDAIGSVIEQYSLEELEEKGGTIARSIVSMWIKDGDEAIDSLNSWLSENTKDIEKMEPLERLKVVEKMRTLDDILLRIGGDAAKGVGVRIGDIVDTYLEILKSGENFANRFLEIVLKYPFLLNELKGIDYGRFEHTTGIFNALDYVIERNMGSIEDIRLEKRYPTVKGLRRVDITFVKKVEEEEVPYIIIEVKTGVETYVAEETLDQVDRDASLIQKRKCTAYYYFDQAPSERGAKQYLGKIRQVYTSRKWSEIVNGKMFVIIEGGEPVVPTDLSLDAYILNPPEG